MGTAHARQQALASRGSGGPAAPGRVQIPGAARQIGDGAVADPSVGTTTGADDGQEDKIPVVFTWTHGGQSVFLAASFNGWREQIPMVRSGNEFSVVQELPRGVHQYKFIVDEHWRCSQDQPKTQNSQGHTNNVMDIQNYQRFQTGTEEAEPARFGQHVPDLSDYTVDAPQIPMVLHKSPCNAVPPRAQVASYQPLSIPNHSLCDHIYLQDRPESNLPFAVAVTHRYGQKYSTTVFATRSPLGGRGAGGRSVNPLKAAVQAGVAGPL